MEECAPTMQNVFYQCKILLKPLNSARAMDWIAFGYAAAIIFGGFMGYKRKGSVMSLIAGLVFGGLSAYGAYNVSNDPKDILVLLASSGLLAVIMGMRYKKSGKLMPAGIMTGLSLLMVFRLLLRTI
ncbi:hypothetical protein CCH79_00001577, partial [Gambusia affinis]